VVSAGLRVPRATARRTVAWLTPRRVATSLELINLCKTCAGLTQHYDKWVTPFRTPLGFPERSRRYAVENAQKSAILLTDSTAKLPMKRCSVVRGSSEGWRPVTPPIK
jgi:hypothetical protein